MDGYQSMLRWYTCQKNNEMNGKKRTSIRQTEVKKAASPSRHLELLLAGCLYYSGLVGLARWWVERSGKKLVILCYHHASGGNLREHLLYLKRHYRLFHLEAALEELYQTAQEVSPLKTRQRTLLALTSDDGYRDLYTYGMPLVCELQVPLTVFLIPGYVASGKRFWWQEPEHLLQHVQVNEATLQGRTYHLTNPEEKQALLQTLDTNIRHVSSVAQRETFLADAYQALAVPCSVEPSEQEKSLLPLNWVEAHEMEASSWISLEAHTMHHPTLAELSDPLELRYEVSECRTILERELGHPVRVFAYPIGKEEHIAETGVQAVQAAAYPWAVTAIHGLNTPQTDPHFLYRIVVDVDQHWLMVAAKASGLWDFLVHLGKIPRGFLKSMFK